MIAMFVKSRGIHDAVSNQYKNDFGLKKLSGNEIFWRCVNVPTCLATFICLILKWRM